MKAATTRTERIMQRITSDFSSVKIDVEPNNVLHTSPETFAEDEKTFMIKYPIARAPTEIMAIAASPFICVFWPV